MNLEHCYKVCKKTDGICNFFQWLLHQTTVTIQGEEETTHWYKKWSSKVAKIIFLITVLYQVKNTKCSVFPVGEKAATVHRRHIPNLRGEVRGSRAGTRYSSTVQATVRTWYSSTVQTAAIASKYSTRVFFQ
jgi:hypothetical protein